MRWAAFAAVSILVVTPGLARAETDPGVALLLDARAGLEGGGVGYAEGVRRSRSLLRFGGEAWLFEPADDMIAVAGLFEIEPELGFGGDLRYQRRLWDGLVLAVGPTAIFAPQTLVGGGLGFSYRPALSDVIELDVGPVGNVHFAGADLPDDVILWQVLVSAGLRFRL